MHRDGVAQVVAHFGPVYDTLATDAEVAFYGELAKGVRTRQALRAARGALALPFAPLAREPQRHGGAPGDAGQTPYAWALLVLYHHGADFPMGLPVLN